MPRRMEIELTSARDDGTFTWRAAGAKQPRGVIDAKLAGQHHVGDVLRVEAEVEMDGITVISVLPSKERAAEAGRIEIHAPSQPAPGVTTTLVERSERRGRDRRSFLDGDDSRDRRPRRPERRPTEGGGGGDRATAARSDRPARPRPERARTERPAGEPTRDRPARPERTDRPDRPARPRVERPKTTTESRPDRSARQRPPRLVPKNDHRDAFMETLPAEQRPIAEQLAAGGLPAVRRAIADDQASAKAEGRTSLNGDAILALAEQMLPAVREASWLDRAEAAVAGLEHITLRDLRASVAGAAPRDEQGRALLTQLRAALDERLTKLRTTWEHEIAHAIEEKRVLHALRLSARPPEPSARFPATLVEPLTEAASAALSSTVAIDRWLALLEAAVASPIRRSIKPAGIPEDPTGAARQAASAMAGRIPALAKLLGLAMPPPPRPLPRPPARPARSAGESSETTTDESDEVSTASTVEAPVDNADADLPVADSIAIETPAVDDAVIAETVVAEPEIEAAADVSESAADSVEDAAIDEPVVEAIAQLEAE